MATVPTPLSDDELILLKLFRKLPDLDQQALLNQAYLWAKLHARRAQARTPASLRSKESS